VLFSLPSTDPPLSSGTLQQNPADFREARSPCISHLLPLINIAEFHINVKFDFTCVHICVNIDSRLLEEDTREELAWELEHVFSRSEIERG
jgi:hypothetical protein